MNSASVAWFLCCILGVINCLTISSLRFAAGASPLLCSPQSTPPFLQELNSQCPSSSFPPSLRQVNGDYIRAVLTAKHSDAYTSVFFYASWCPFSHQVHSTFEVLSSMYPEIVHLAVEESSAADSLLSQYGIHSLPAVFMIKQKSRLRHYGSKDLDSLIKFYRETTGYEPVQSIVTNKSVYLTHDRRFDRQPSVASSLSELLRREALLIFAILFICLRVVVCLLPRVFRSLKYLWLSNRPHLNSEFFGKACRVLARVLPVIALRRIWAKLNFCGNQNLNQGAKNARVWASSLASVSLSDTSTSRSF